MTVERFTITNDQGEKIIGLLHRVANPKGTAIVQHGLSAFKEQPQIETIAACCIAAGWQTITFDTRHTFGESDGDIEHATLSTYRADLDLIIKSLVPDDHKLLLFGSSLGASSILTYACDHPKRVTAIGPLATQVSQDLYIEKSIKNDPVFFAQWKADGRYLKKSNSRPGREGYVSWDLVEDFKKLKVLDRLDDLTMPIFMAVGENDTATPPEQQQLLFDLWQGPKELHIFPNAEHTLKGQTLPLLAEKLGNWLQKQA